MRPQLEDGPQNCATISRVQPRSHADNLVRAGCYVFPLCNYLFLLSVVRITRIESNIKLRSIVSDVCGNM